MAEKHILIEYTNLLHKFRDPNAAEVKRFFEKAKALDPDFEARAKKLQLLFQGSPSRKTVKAANAPGAPTYP